MNLYRQNFTSMFLVFMVSSYSSVHKHINHIGCSMLTYQQSPELLSFLCTVFTTVGLSVAHTIYERFIAIVYFHGGRFTCFVLPSFCIKLIGGKDLGYIDGFGKFILTAAQASMSCGELQIHYGMLSQTRTTYWAYVLYIKMEPNSHSTRQYSMFAINLRHYLFLTNNLFKFFFDCKHIIQPYFIYTTLWKFIVIVKAKTFRSIVLLKIQYTTC